MKKASQSLWIPAISWLLILQLAVGSTLLSIRPAYANNDEDRNHRTSQSESLIDQLTAEGANHPENIAGREKLEALAQEIENAGERDAPKEFVDAFHITKQRLEIPSGKSSGSYELSSLRIGLPTVVADFDREVSIEHDRNAKELAIVKKKKGNVLAKHVIGGLDVVAFARDKEMLQFVDSKGKIYVVDMAYARGAAFKGPLPVFTVGQLPAAALENGTVKDIKVAFISRGIQPPQSGIEGAVVPVDVAERDWWRSGDFMVTTTNTKGERVLIGVYNRGVSQMQMYTGNAVVSFLAAMVSPPDKDAQMKAAMAPLADPMVASEAKRVEGSLDPLTREALMALPEETLANLQLRSVTNKARAQSPRDTMELGEWHKSVTELRARAERELEVLRKQNSEQNADRIAELEAQLRNNEFAAEWQGAVQEWMAGAERLKNRLEKDYKKKKNELLRPEMAERIAMLDQVLRSGVPSEEIRADLYQEIDMMKRQRGIFYRVMTSKAMKIVAGVTAGSAVLLGIPHLAETGNGPTWAVWLANQVYHHDFFPAVLKDAAYRVTLLKSCLALTAFVPILHTIGILYGKGKGWNAIKAKAALGIRAAAIFVRAFWIGISEKVLRQPNMREAWALGLSPFAKVTKKSAIGKKVGLEKNARLGVSKGFINTENRKRDLELKRRLLETVKVQQNRIKGYSKMLSIMVVAEKYGIDPVTMLLVQTGRVSDAKAEALRSDPAFQEQWLKIAHEIATVLGDMKNGTIVPDVSELTREQLLADYKLAKATAEDIAGRKGVQKLAAGLRTQWKEFGTRARKWVGTFSEAEYQFLKQVEPSMQVSKEAWRQFFTDYILAVWQMGYFGHRADFSHPADMAASRDGKMFGPDSIFWTNKGHAADMFDQAVRGYGVQNPADLALVFQKNSQPTEGVYDPIETMTVEGKARPESFVRGMFSWTKAAMSLEANYGFYIMKNLVKKIRTIQSSLILSMGARLALAGQSWGQATSGYALVFIAGMWVYAWPWMPLIRGNAIYEERIEAKNAVFMAAKAKIGQGLRLGNQEMMQEGYKSLTDLFSKHLDGEMPKRLRKDLARAEAFLKIPNAERIAWAEDLRKMYGPAARLSDALQALNHASKYGNKASIEEAKAEVERAYRDVVGQYNGEMQKNLLELNAKSLLDFAKKHPPFYNKAHPMVAWATTIVVAVTTTYLATALFAQSYSKAMSFAVLEKALILSASLYATVHFGQKALNKLGERIDYIRTHNKMARQIQVEAFRPDLAKKEGQTFDKFRREYVRLAAKKLDMSKRQVEAAMSESTLEWLSARYHGREVVAPAATETAEKAVPENFEDYLRDYVEQKAKEFRVDPRDVRAEMDAGLVEILRRRHAAELTRGACQSLLTDAGAVKPFGWAKISKILIKGK